MIHSPAMAWAMGYPSLFSEHLFHGWHLGIEMFSQVYHGFGDLWIGRTFMGV